MWRLEARGGKGCENFVVIQPVTDDDPYSDVKHVRIRVTPLGQRWQPTMPFFPEGMVYTDRNGLKYTIITSMITEIGPPDGEHSMWVYDYLAVIGAHRLIGVAG